MNRSLQYVVWTPIALILLSASSCSDNGAPPEKTAAIAALNGLWTTECTEELANETIANSTPNYSIQTLQFDSNSASQTISYYQDASCSVPILEPLAEIITETGIDSDNVNQTISDFIQQQTTEMSVSFPFGMTITDLGNAQHFNLQDESIAFNGITLTDVELAERGLELNTTIGIFVVTPSDRLHFSTNMNNRRPTTVPLDLFFTRTLEVTTLQE